VLPALLAGNPVILKPSPQTPLCGEWFEQLYRLAGLPPHVLQVLHVTPTQVDRLVRDPRIQYVMFTGSVANGHAVIKSASDSFKGVGRWRVLQCWSELLQCGGERDMTR
jgi:acyl-CoA reductase-like NAD-dependent aldehyde dehydrogenase